MDALTKVKEIKPGQILEAMAKADDAEAEVQKLLTTVKKSKQKLLGSQIDARLLEAIAKADAAAEEVQKLFAIAKKSKQHI